MATVTYDRASRVYPGGTQPAVDQLSLDIADGEFLVLVGPSGCGKSTSLRMLAGLEPIDRGTVRIGTVDVTTVPPRDRDIAMVFQSYALYPHMTVGQNMGFALKLAGVGKDERERRVAEAARLLDLTGLLERKPKALSGGQRQRVAMGRAIVREPRVFCMDEPLSNLDAKLRVHTRSEIAALQKRLGVTTVYVTHDQVEAMTMGDRVAVMDRGVLQQCGTPRALYENPVNVFVAGFIGSPAMNLGSYPIADGAARIGTATVPLPREVLAQAGGLSEITLGFRPEALTVVGAAEAGPETLEATVDVVEELGSDAYLYGRLAGTVGETAAVDGQLVTARIAARTSVERGNTVRLRLRPEGLHAFHPQTGARLG